jgi:hypothetical protein
MWTYTFHYCTGLQSKTEKLLCMLIYAIIMILSRFKACVEGREIIKLRITKTLKQICSAFVRLCYCVTGKGLRLSS